MNLRCKRDKLLEAIQTCQRAISGKSMLPILSGVLFKGDKNMLYLSSTDLEISIRTEIEVEAKEGGNIVVPARLISDILNSLEEEEVELNLLKDKAQLEVVSGGSKFSLNVYFEEDFPKIPVAAGSPACELKGEEFIKTVKEVAKAASRDESKPVLTGVLIEISADTLRMVATDSYRLAVCEGKIEGGPKEDIRIIVPARSLRELHRIMSSKETGNISVNLTENQVIFKTGHVDLVSRLIDGDFPNYKQIIPEGYEKIIKINKNKALGAVKRTAILAQNNAPIKLAAVANTITISANTQDVGEAVEKIEVDYAGEEVKIAFNPEFLLDGLNSVEEDTIVIEITDPLKPAMVKPEKDKSFQYLIMPVRLT